MTDKIYNVLFVCTHNSARSILAEGLLNSAGGRRFKAYSAGSHPAGTVNPLALHTLGKMRIPSDGYRSKDWSEYGRPGAPEMDFVFNRLRQRRGRGVPGMARSADDGPLGGAGPFGGARNR